MQKLFLSLILVLSIPIAQAMAPAAAAANEQELVRQALLPFNGDPNGVDEHDNNALHTPLSLLHILNIESPWKTDTTIKALLKAGTRCNHENRDGDSPLDHLKKGVIRYSFHPKVDYGCISNAIKESLQEVQSARQLTREILAINGLPVDALTNLICEYASLNNRSKEIHYVKKHHRQNSYELERQERNIKIYTIVKKIATMPRNVQCMLATTAAATALNSLTYCLTNHYTLGEYVACSVLKQETACAIAQWPFNS